MKKQDVIRVLLVDDQSAIHAAVGALIKDAEDIMLMGQAFNGKDAIELCKRGEPDVVLMDVVMPGIDGPEATKILLENSPDLKILVLSSYYEYEYIKSAINNGAIGYLVKDVIVDELLETIRAVYKGSTVLSPQILETIMMPPLSDAADFNLTEREHEVLKEMATGSSNSQLAIALKITVPTVRFHIKNIINKMGVGTRSEALVLAAKNNLI